MIEQITKFTKLIFVLICSFKFTDFVDIAFVSFTSNIESVSPYLRMIILPLAICLGSNRSTATRAILVIDLAIVISSWCLTKREVAVATSPVVAHTRCHTFGVAPQRCPLSFGTTKIEISLAVSKSWVIFYSLLAFRVHVWNQISQKCKQKGSQYTHVPWLPLQKLITYLKQKPLMYGLTLGICVLVCSSIVHGAMGDCSLHFPITPNRTMAASRSISRLPVNDACRKTQCRKPCPVNDSCSQHLLQLCWASDICIRLISETEHPSTFAALAIASLRVSIS